jgi:RNA polymerase sigma factor (sigma-70 family)
MASKPGARLGSIEAIYRSDFPRLLHVATAITGDVELAADAVQEGFANAIRHRRDFRGDGPLAGWLWRTVVNCARARAGRTRELSLDVDPLDEHTRAGNGHEDAGALRLAIATLPERQRLVLFLRYYADLDYAAIATALEISPGTVGATLNAAHRAMRPLIEEVSL